MIQNAPKTIMFVFFGIGVLFILYSVWAQSTDIPQEQFQEDPRFEEEYMQYYQSLGIFGIAMIILGGIIAVVGRKMNSK